jgi:hypothetical protein
MGFSRYSPQMSGAFLENRYIRQISKPVVVIKTIADNIFIGNINPFVIYRDINQPPLFLVEKCADFQ